MKFDEDLQFCLNGSVRIPEMCVYSLVFLSREAGEGEERWGLCNMSLVCIAVRGNLMRCNAMNCHAIAKEVG